MPKVTLELPRLHPAQQHVIDTSKKYNVPVLGRRAGKTTLCARDRVIDCAVIKRLPVAYTEPSYKMMVDVFEHMITQMEPVIHRLSRSLFKIWLKTRDPNGDYVVIDFWSADKPDAIRGHPYGLLVADEAGLYQNLKELWEDIFFASLGDYDGQAWFPGTPKGKNFYYTLFLRGGDPAYKDWASWQLPTSCNPYYPASHIEEARMTLSETAFLQEFEAQFLDSGAGVFRNVEAVIDKNIHGNIPPEKYRVYTLGVDFAKYSDFNVITVFRDDGLQVYFERSTGVLWETQIDKVCEVAIKYNAMVVCDSTGLGDPVTEQIRRKLWQYAEGDNKAGINVYGYVFTNQSKRELMECYSLDIERDKLTLRDIEIQTSELQAYAYDVTPSGNITMNAPEGQHDDTVCAGALANWGRRRQGEVTLPAKDMRTPPEGLRIPIEELDRELEGWNPDEYEV